MSFAETPEHRANLALPEGYELEQDAKGDWILVPPPDVTIFSLPGEGWLVTDDFMAGRDWSARDDVLAACGEYLAKLRPARADTPTKQVSS